MQRIPALLLLIALAATGCTPTIMWTNTLGESLNLPPGEGHTKEDVCARWSARAESIADEMWDGEDEQCSDAPMSSAWRDDSITLMNTYRWIAQLDELAVLDERNAAAQACALYMDANGVLDHQIESDDDGRICFSDQAKEGAQSANLAARPAVLATHLYMIDSHADAVNNLGHRRWLLSNDIGPIGVGSTNETSCLWVLNGDERPGRTWTAWPPPGAVPMNALRRTDLDDADVLLSVDGTGWSIQSDDIDLTDVTVVVESGGDQLDVVTRPMEPSIGSVTAIAFRPDGWTLEVDETYTVSVPDTDISYEFTVVDCQ